MIRVYLCFAILFILPLNARAADGPREPLPAGAKFRLGSDLFKNNVGFMWKYGTLAPDDKGLLCPKRLEVFDLATGRGSKWHAADALKDRWLEGEPQYSADAQRLLTADRDRYRVWDVATNRELLAVERKFGFDSVGLLSADGAKLAAIVKGKTVVWDVATGKAAPELTYPAMEFAEVGLSPDGKTLAVSGRRNFKMALQLWDTEKGKELAILNGPSGMPSSPAFAPDGKTVAMDGSEQVWILDARTGQEVRQIDVQKATRHILQYTPDGKGLLVTADYGGTSEWFEAVTGKLLHTTRCPVPLRVKSRGVRFTGPDRAVAWGEEWNAAYAWEVPSGKPLTPVDGHAGQVRGLAFTAGGKEIVTAGYDGRTMRWDGATGKFLGVIEFRKVREDLGPYLTLAPTGRTGFSERAVYDLATGAALAEWPDTLKLGRYVPTYPSADGKRVAFLVMPYSPPKGRCVVCDAETGKIVVDLAFDADAAKGSKAEGALSADGTRVVVSVCSKYFFGRPENATVLAWDVAGGKKLFEGVVPGARGEEGAVVLAPDDKTAYLSSLSGPAFALDPATGKVGRRFGSDKLKSSAHVVVSGDGKRLAVSEATETGPDREVRAVRVYDTTTGKQLSEFDTPDAPVAFTPDNMALATRSPYAVLVWELAGPKGK